jgi:hypothetical protein
VYQGTPTYLLKPDLAFTSIVAVGSATAFYCSGVLISPSLVLTARHCLPASRVLFGNTIARPVAILQVKQTQVPDDKRLDAGVLVLATPVTVTPSLRRGAQDQSPPTGMVRLVGFGSDDPTGKLGFGVKRQVDAPTLGWGCDGYRVRSAGCEPDLELVLPRSGDRDTCDGDSGGPVLEWNDGGWRLVAITSRPVASARQSCGPGGIYERADRLAPWLDEQVRRTDPVRTVEVQR